MKFASLLPSKSGGWKDCAFGTKISGISASVDLSWGDTGNLMLGMFGGLADSMMEGWGFFIHVLLFSTVRQG